MQMKTYVDNHLLANYKNVLSNTFTKPQSDTITNKPTIPQNINCLPLVLSVSLSALHIYIATPVRNANTAREIITGTAMPKRPKNTPINCEKF